MKFNEFLFDKTDENLITEEQLYEMARVKPKDSGVPWVIFISTKEYVKQRHWARIKVSNVKGTFSPTDNFSVYISKTDPYILAGETRMSSDELEDIYEWVKFNYEVLMKYWNDKYESDADMYNELRKI